MEKTRCRLNICGVEVTVSGDMDRAAAERIAEAVRSRMQQVLNTAYAASIEKAAVITAMNLCEELARQEAALRQSEEKAAQLEEELARYRSLPVPAIVSLPGQEGATGYGMNSLRRAVERAVGADILFQDLPEERKG